MTLPPPPEISLSPRWRYIGVSLVVAGALASTAWQMFNFTNQLTETLPATAITSEPSSNTSSNAQPNELLANLFGGANSTESAPPSAVLPESTLDIQVSAIFFTNTPSSSSAILEDGDKVLMVRPGDEVRAGVLLEGVEPLRVTLKRNGKFEQITFRGFDESGGSNVMSNLPSAQITPQLQPPPPPPEGTKQPSANANTEPPPLAYQKLIQRNLTQH